MTTKRESITEVIDIKSDAFNHDLKDVMKNILDQGEYSDLNLIPDDDEEEAVKVHKFIMCAMSSYIKEQVEKSENISGETKTPLTIRLPGIGRNILNSILTFAYTGTVSIKEEELTLFKTASAVLGIRHLYSQKVEAKNKRKQNKRPLEENKSDQVLKKRKMVNFQTSNDSNDEEDQTNFEWFNNMNGKSKKTPR